MVTSTSFPSLSKVAGTFFKKKDWFFLLALALLCFKLTQFPYTTVDIMLADESYYLSMAQGFHLKHLFTDGFVYFIWLKLLSVFFPDLVTLYFVNYGILVAVNAFLFYSLARKFGKEPFLSAVLATFFLVSIVNVFTWPFITRFASAVFLSTLLGVQLVRTTEKKFLVTGIGLLALLYVRPEYTLSFIVFAVFAAGYFWHKKGLSNWRGLLGLLLGVCLITVIKSPVSSQRSLMAFGQHFGANLAEREKIRLNPWTQWQQVLTQKFGTCKTPLAALLHNPSEVKKHVLTNIKKTGPIFYYQLFPYHSLTWPRWLKRSYSVVILFVFGLTFYYFWLELRNFYKNRRSGSWLGGIWDGEKWFFWGIVVLVAIPTLISVFVVYPRTHYILVFFAILCALIVRYFPGLPVLPRVGEFIKMPLFLVLVLLIPWNGNGERGLLPGKNTRPCTTATRILAVKGVPVRGDVRLLYFLYHTPFNNDYFQMFVRSATRHHYTFFSPKKGEDLALLIREKGINMIYVNEKLLAGLSLAELLPEQTRKEWQILGVSCPQELILVKKNLLKSN